MKPPMQKVLTAHPVAPFALALQFSDRSQGIWRAEGYLSSHSGPLLEKLRDAAYFARVFIDAGALCWPNGLELSPARLHALAGLSATLSTP